MLDTSVMSLRPQGPMMSPAARKPRIEDIFESRKSETATTAAVSRMATCASEIIQLPAGASGGSGCSAGRGMNSLSPGTRAKCPCAH